MKKIAIVILIIALILIIIFAIPRNSEAPQEVGVQNPIVDVYVTPIEHATMVINWGNDVIYIDPVGGSGAFAGHLTPDIILITDNHKDHFDNDTLEAISTASTTIIAPKAVVDTLSDQVQGTVVMMNNREGQTFGTITYTTIPMYNLPESDDAFHTRGRGNAYGLSDGNTRLYIAGDTGPIPEMRELTNMDVAFIPMNLPYTMSVEDAADAVLEFAPKQVYPYHYRGLDGFSDVDLFRKLVNEGNPNIEVVQLDWYPE